MTEAEHAVPGVLHPNPTGNLSGHETLADDGAKRQAPDLSQGLPGVRVVPHQCDDAEQHRRRTKDDTPVLRRLHTEKITDIGGCKLRSRVLELQVTGVAPDIPISTSAEEYFSGHDPAVEYIFSATVPQHRGNRQPY